MMRDARHDCKLPSPPPQNDTELLRKIRNVEWWQKLIVLTNTNPKSYAYFRSFFDRKKEIVRHLQTADYRYIIHPFSKFRHFWELYMFLIFFVSLIVIPLNVVEHGHDVKRTVLLTCWVATMDIMCLIDLCVTFRTGYLNGRVVVLEPKLIRKNYLFSIYFPIDFLSSIPIDFLVTVLYSDSKEMLYLELLSLFKIVRLRTMVTYETAVCDMLGLSLQMSLVIKLSTILIIVIHWLTCANYIFPFYFAIFFNKFDESWISAKFADKTPSLKELYFECLFRVFSIIGGGTHDGYIIKNDVEAIFSSCCLVTISIGYCFVIVTIMTLILINCSGSLNFVVYMEQVHNYVTGKDLKPDIRDRLFEYLHYYYAGLYINERNIKILLSQKILEDVLMYRVQVQLRNTFLMLLPEIDRKLVVSHLKEEIYTPNDTIIKAGTKGNCMYFIASGTVVVRSPAGKEICHLENGDYFGEIALIFKGQTRTADVSALEFCCLYTLDKKLFHSKIAGYENIMESVKTIASNRMAVTAEVNALYLQLIHKMQEAKILSEIDY